MNKRKIVFVSSFVAIAVIALISFIFIFTRPCRYTEMIQHAFDNVVVPSDIADTESFILYLEKYGLVNVYAILDEISYDINLSSRHNNRSLLHNAIQHYALENIIVEFNYSYGLGVTASLTYSLNLAEMGLQSRRIMNNMLRIVSKRLYDMNDRSIIWGTVNGSIEYFMRECGSIFFSTDSRSFNYNTPQTIELVHDILHGYNYQSNGTYNPVFQFIFTSNISASEVNEHIMTIYW